MLLHAICKYVGREIKYLVALQSLFSNAVWALQRFCLGFAALLPSLCSNLGLQVLGC